MNFIDELNKAVKEYPKDNMQMNVTWVPTPDGKIHQGNTVTFYVHAQNNGHFDLFNLQIHIRENSFGNVSFNSLIFDRTELIPPSFSLNAHSSIKLGPYFFKARNDITTNGEKKYLVKIHLHGYDVSLDHILRDHSDHAAADDVETGFYAKIE